MGNNKYVILVIFLTGLSIPGAFAREIPSAGQMAMNPILMAQSEVPAGSAEQARPPVIPQGQSGAPSVPQGQSPTATVPQGQTPTETVPQGQSQTPPVPQGQSRQTSVPVGQTEGTTVSEEDGIGADIFGRQGGRIHPFVSFQVLHTDNLFATRNNKQSDWVTTIAPGIWVALPANREKLLTIDTNLTSSGGLKLGRIKPEATRRYQMYALYSPELILYKDTSRHDHWNHTLEGLFQYNFNSGLSFDVIDVFHDREEIAGNGIDDTLFRHQDNLFDFITTFDSDSRKFKVQFNYANYDLNYKDPVVAYRDRNDNSLGLTLFYKFKPKTSLLAGIRYADIAFDTGTINDNEEIGYYGGISWEVTARSRGTFRLGYLEKDFDDDRVKDQDGFSVELQTQHNFTAKRGVNVMGYRKFHESDLAGASSFLSTGIDIALLQRFNEKWSGNLNFVYEENEYNGINRDDRFFSIGPAIRFEPRKWLFFDLGYTYFDNDSNIDFFDYEVNQFYLRVTASL